MKLIGWAIVLAAAGLTPAAAQAPQAAAPAPQAAAPAASAASAAAEPAAPAAAGAAPAATAAASAPVTPPTPGIGVPVGGRGIQEQVTGIGRQAAGFHNNWLLALCALISLFVLGLLAYTMVRYRRGAHPVPTRTSHNTVIEVVWTLVPVLILVAIAIPSIRLLRAQYSPPAADLTVKVIGHQWSWTYEYPDHGVSIDSYMLKEASDKTRQANQRARTDADGPPMLAADERMVIPVGAVVKFIITSDDVIHAFWVPAFWNKIDANPGQLNEIWAKVDRPGVYFGQCTELCGARHAYMPIAVEAVSPARFAAWVASKGGQMPGARPAPTPDSTAASPTSTPAVPAAAQPTPPRPAAADPAAIRQPAMNQAATARN
jgi:cytochrome c oxidase subunit 2